MSKKNQVGFDVQAALPALKAELKQRAALDGMTALMWLGGRESLAAYLSAEDWAEIRAAAKGAK
jgi:hypothetical protein